MAVPALSTSDARASGPHGVAELQLQGHDRASGQAVPPALRRQILYSGQPIALVVAETFEAARAGAALVTATYKSEEHITDLEAVKGQSYVPPKRRSGIAPPPSPRGKADVAFEPRR